MESVGFGSAQIGVESIRRHCNEIKYLVIANEPDTWSAIILVVCYHHIIGAHLQ